jgi:hypothetical protein
MDAADPRINYSARAYHLAKKSGMRSFAVLRVELFSLAILDI